MTKSCCCWWWWWWCAAGSLLVLAALHGVTDAQTPCSTTNCGVNAYCSELPSGETQCLACHSSCVGCDGPDSISCKACKIGYYREVDTISPCNVCPLGYFGVDCLSQCHCLDNGLCNNTNGHCNGWKCERGYTGIPECQTICDEEKFGLDCQLTCHCPEGDNCSHVNGDCSSGQCHQDWGSSGCQKRLPRMTRGPTVVGTACNRITLTWPAFNDSYDIGDGPVGQYIVYRQLVDSSNPSNTWVRAGVTSVILGQLSYTYIDSVGLVDDAEYLYRLDAVGLEDDKLMQRVSVGPMSSPVINPCTETTTDPPETTTKFLYSRKVFDSITMEPINQTYVVIRWTVLTDYQGLDYNVSITRQFLGHGDCDSNGGSLSTFDLDGINSDPVGFKGLEVWGRYRFEVTAVATSSDVRETVTEIVTTLSGIPTGVITVFSVDRVTAEEAEVSWDPPPCNQRLGPLSFYSLALFNMNKTGATELVYSLTEPRHQMDNLDPYSTFSVTLSYNNDAGPGPTSVFFFTTNQGAPSAVEILGLSATYSTITVSFQPPEFVNGVLVSYTVTYSETTNFDISESITVSASIGLSIITVPRLKSETTYFLRMAANSEAAIGQFGQIKQLTTLEPPPPAEAIGLKRVARTTQCLTLEWTPPAVENDTITHFILEIQRATAEGSIQPITIQLLPTVTSYQQCDLRPSSLYIVTISAHSLDGVISTATENFSTQHGVPPTPAAPIFVRSHYTNITVAIQPVVSTDVPISAYQLQVERVNVAGRRRRFAGVPGTVTAELAADTVTQTIEFIIGDGQSYGGYVNEALERETYYMVYYVALSQLNNETTASVSQLQAAVRTVPFDPALVPPVAISVDSKTTECLNITWELPSGVAEVATGLVVSVRPTSEDTSPVISSQDLAPTATSFQQCQLKPFTLYTAEIVVKTENSVLPPSQATFTTVHSVPRLPVAPVFVNSSFTTITVSIEPVVLTEGPLSAYQLQVEKVTNRKRRTVSWLKPWLSELPSSEGELEGLSREKRVAGVPGYVAAQLTQTDITQKMDFVLGDGNVYNGYTNAPLDRDALYTVHYVVLSTSSNITKYSYATLKPPVRTVPYIPPTPPPVNNESSDNSVLIGVIVALVLFLLIILLLLLLYYWWRKKNRFNPYQIQEDDNKKMAFHHFKDDYDPEKYWSHIYNLKDSRHIVAGRDLVYTEGPLPYMNGQAIEDPAMPKVSFKNEFQSLPHKSKRATDNIAQQNKRLNRFPHLLPYDHSLVQLRPDSNSSSTYINASFIPGYKKIPAYIAAQSPFDDVTVLDFWRLIYQRSIKTVVMITNVVEDNIVKCTQYWPDSTKASYGNFFLELIDCTYYADYIVRTIGVTLKGVEHAKIVKLFEFTSWPDHGVPDDPIPFLEMRYKVKRYHNDERGPILVHCGTGVARTGVFIAVDALIEAYAMEGRAMTFDFVRRIRKDRPFMVRTLKQYVFIYEALFEEFHAGDTLVDFDLKQRYHNWTQKNPRTDHTYLRDQFQLLDSYTRGPRREECKTSLLEVNIKKNRYFDVLPAEKHRPVLLSPGGLNPTDYINAVYVDGYQKKNQFIITQTPLHTTIIDFWKLVYDHDVRTIVMVENFQNKDDTCAEYWPSVNLKHFEPFFIETTAEYQQDNITIRNFKLHSTDQPKSPAKFVRQFQFNSWAQTNPTPQSKTLMLDLIDMVFDWQEESCVNEKPIIVHCQDGSSHSGLFAIVSVICEKMELEEEVDVYRAIKHIKRRRPQFIADYDQFRFCYKSLWDFMSLRMPGGTFTETLGQTKADKLYGVASLNLSSFGGSGFNTIDLNDTTEL